MTDRFHIEVFEMAGMTYIYYGQFARVRLSLQEL
jgi:hypothetical protein